MRYRERYAVSVALWGMVLCALSYSPICRSAETAVGPPGNTSIPFTDNLENALAQAQTSHKPLVLAFEAVWCPNCLKMKRTTLPAPQVTALSESFHWVKIDIDRNVSLARSYNVNAVPQLLLLDSDGTVRDRIVGVIGPTEFRVKLDQFLQSGEQYNPVDLAQTPQTERQHTTLTWRPAGYRANSICFSHVGYGPLRIKSQSPFQSLRLALAPRTPSTLARHDMEFRATGTWANVFAIGEIQDLDYETFDASLSFAYGISDTFEVEVEFEDRSRFGGKLDPLSEGFHDVFGIDQNDRDEIRDGQFTFELRPPGGQPVSLSGKDRGSFSRSILTTIQHNVTCGTATLPAFAYAFTVRQDVGDSNDLRGGSKTDFAISVAVSRKFGNFYGYGTIGYARFGRDNFRGIPLRDDQLTLLSALEWRWRPKQSFLFQYLWTEALADNLGPFSDASQEVTFGWKMEIRHGSVIELGIVENIITVDNSPDFALHAGFSRRF